MNINSIIFNYLQETENAKQAKKRADELKTLILDYAKNTESFSTDIYTVSVKVTPSERLDTTALYRDFPDIKKTYGKITTSKSINVIENAEIKKCAG